jgi:signal transduction histidine kinase
MISDPERRELTFEAFVALTEAVGSETDIRVLALRAIEVLQSFLSELSVTYSELDDGLWKVRVLSGDVAPEVAAFGLAGYPFETPILLRAVEAGQCTFIDGFDAVKEGVPHAESYGAVTLYPYFRARNPIAMLFVGTQQARRWTEAERTLISAVGRSLGLALERAAQTLELQIRNAALDAYVRFTGQVASARDLKTLVAAADSVIWEALGDSLCAYYLVQGERALPEVFSLGVRPDLQARLEEGIPLALPVVQAALNSRQTAFAEQALGRDQALSIVGGSTVTALSVTPYFRDGRPHALFSSGSERSTWTAREKAIIRSVGQALGAATERLEQARQLEEERTALGAFVAFTEAVGTTTDAAVLGQQSIELLSRTLDVDVTYFEREGETFVLRSWSSGFPPELLARSQQGYTLDQPSFAEAARLGQAVFVDDWDASAQQVPESEVYGAAALHPFMQGGEMVALLSMATPRAQQRWSARDQAVFRAVGRSLALGLERARQSRQLSEERAALDAFVAFTEAAADATDIHLLARQAVNVLQATLSEVTVVYYDLEDGLWKSRVWSDDLPAEIAAVLEAGISSDAPSYAEVTRTREPLFIPGWEAERERVAETEAYGAGALYPCFVDSGPQGLLGMGTQRAKNWTTREQAVFRAVGRSLTLALERAEVSRQLQLQNEELLARTQALEGFAELTRDLAVQSEPEVLIRQALEVIHRLLPDGYVSFHQPEEGRWRARLQVGDRRSPDLQRALDEGLPYASVPSLVIPWTTGEPMFQDAYHVSKDGLQIPDVSIQAVATLPVLVRGESHGVLVAALFGRQHWAGVNRVVLETVVRSLGQAIERAQGAGALVERSRELQAANNELEAFSYSVSHDLRTPVRHVKGFSELARKALVKANSEQAVQHMLVVEKAALRMNALIDAMLDLSRTSQQALKMEAVDLNVLTQRARQDAEQDRVDGSVVWKISPLPTVQGDRASLQQVMNNLVANAVKYSRTRPEAVIDIWAEQTADSQVIHIRDNGVGFNPEYRDRLFGVFQRLHTDRDFEGTGVGLAIVRRIVLRHGGTASADSIPGHGATFSFTLPKAR